MSLQRQAGQLEHLGSLCGGRGEVTREVLIPLSSPPSLSPLPSVLPFYALLLPSIPSPIPDSSKYSSNLGLSFK